MQGFIKFVSKNATTLIAISALTAGAVGVANMDNSPLDTSTWFADNEQATVETIAAEETQTNPPTEETKMLIDTNQGTAVATEETTPGFSINLP